MDLIQKQSSIRPHHYPTLKTVMMVEDTLRSAKGSAMTIPELKRSLPRKINSPTLKTILEYLEASGKIAVTLRGITWVRKSNEPEERERGPMPDKRSVLEKLEASRRSFDRYGVKSLGLFGSYARGDEREGSDIDIIVEFLPGRKTFDNYMDLKFFLEKLLGGRVDLVMKEAVKPALSKEIFGSAINVT